MLVNGVPMNVLHKGINMVVVIDESVDGGQKVIYTTDVKQVKPVKHAYGHIVGSAPKRNKRKRMTNAEKLFSNTPTPMSN